MGHLCRNRTSYRDGGRHVSTSPGVSFTDLPFARAGLANAAATQQLQGGGSTTSRSAATTVPTSPRRLHTDLREESSCPPAPSSWSMTLATCSVEQPWS